MKRPFLMMGALALALWAPSNALAQDAEQPGEARGGYAWGSEGEGGASTGGAEQPEDPLRVMAFAGAGVGFRLVRNLDMPFNQDFLAPAYLDLGAAVYLPGREVRHGVSLYVSSNITQGNGSGGVRPWEQWSIAPGYSFLLPFQRLVGMDNDMLQMQGRVAVPLVFGSALGGGDGIDFSVGLELGLALHIKFLAGLGVYLEAQAAVYGGSNDTIHPTISVDGGLMWDYEVLP